MFVYTSSVMIPCIAYTMFGDRSWTLHGSRQNFICYYHSIIVSDQSIIVSDQSIIISDYITQIIRV